MRTLRRKGMLDGPALRQLPTRAELRRFFAFGSFIVVLFVKQLVYNQAVLLASILGTAAGAAHQVRLLVPSTSSDEPREP